jgi:predicted transcriptional regulator of viral defense system
VPDDRLPSTFTYTQARKAGMSKRALYKLRDQGDLEILAPGLFRRSDESLTDLDLLTIAGRAPQATLCLTSALAIHGLTDTIPSEHDIALPRGVWHPALSIPVRWHSFDPSTFTLGRTLHPLDATTNIGLYDPERTIVDVFRLRHQLGSDVAHEALRRWLRAGGQPSRLLTIAEQFPRTLAPLRQALEVLI